MKDESIKFFSIKEVAQRYSLSKSKVYQLVENKEIGCLRIGKAIRISSKDLESFEKKNYQRRKRKRPF